jgi:hypothetical protein
MMLAISFLMFFALVIAWLAAPTSEPQVAPAPAAAPLLTTSEAVPA